jgi:hypothetical protein
MEQAERLANAGIQHKVWIEDDMAGLKILLFWSLLNFNERFSLYCSETNAQTKITTTHWQFATLQMNLMLFVYAFLMYKFIYIL